MFAIYTFEAQKVTNNPVSLRFMWLGAALSMHMLMFEKMFSFRRVAGSTKLLWLHWMGIDSASHFAIVHIPSFPQRSYTCRNLEDHLQSTLRVNSLTCSSTHSLTETRVRSIHPHSPSHFQNPNQTAEIVKRRKESWTALKRIVTIRLCKILHTFRHLFKKNKNKIRIGKKCVESMWCENEMPRKRRDKKNEEKEGNKTNTLTGRKHNA